MSESETKTPKTCLSCYRPFEYRKKWEKNWADVKYCSDQCRNSAKNKKNLLDKNLMESKIIELCNLRKPKSICPSEVVRALFENWQPYMEPVREVSRKLHLEQKIVITQKEIPIKDINFKGPIRIKIKV